MMMAAVDAAPTNLLDPVAQFGSTAVIGALLIWVIAKTLPAKDRLLTEQLAKRDQHWGTVVKDLVAQVTATNNHTAQVLDRLQQHCVAKGKE